MDPITAKLMSAAGAAEEATYVDDVFSIDVWDGDGASTRTITNGIDLAGEGGMVWGKTRSTSVAHVIADTENGVSKNLFTNTTDALEDRGTGNGSVDQFNSDGFAIGDSNNFINYSGHTACSWTFRKCPGFFDVVTYTGNGTAGLSISHSLGSVPGFIMVKKTSGSDGWFCYHRSLGNTKMVALNGTGAAGTATQYWNNTSPTSTTFTVGTDSAVNANGQTYVAYIFAHDDQSFGDDGDEAVIKCGSFNSTGSVVDINLGFEPQWILMKRSDASNSWILVDSMRGNPVGSAARYLEPNASAAESTITGWTVPTPTGFTNNYPINGGTFIYIAIRRPHKPPENATDVFDVFSDSGSSSTELRPGTSGSGVTDVAVFKRTSNSRNPTICYRLLGNRTLFLHQDTSADTSILGSTNPWDQMQGLELEVDDDTNVSGGTFLNYYFSRAPGFMDVVTYTGNGSSGRTIPHNLGIAPELIILTGHDFSQEWAWLVNKGSGHSGVGNGNSSFSTPSAAKWGNGSNYVAPTATSFTVGNDNATNGDSSKNYVGILFGSVDGISKVGTYTGTGSQLDIDCGFSGNARFVIIKHLSGGGHFMWFDTVQGIVSGNDQHWRSNVPNNPVSHTDYIDPYSGGFSLPASDSNANASGGTYLFFAIA